MNNTRQRNTILIIAAIAVVVFGLAVLIIWRWKKSAAASEKEVTPVVSVKVAKAADGASLPGYTFTQEGSF